MSGSACLQRGRQQQVRRRQRSPPAIFVRPALACQLVGERGALRVRVRVRAPGTRSQPMHSRSRGSDAGRAELYRRPSCVRATRTDAAARFSSFWPSVAVITAAPRSLDLLRKCTTAPLLPTLAMDQQDLLPAGMPCGAWLSGCRWHQGRPLVGGQGGPDPPGLAV
jgi:hypothetical protein